MPTPSWLKPVAVVALLWNLLGCVAYISDVTMSAEAVAQMTPAQQALYQSRPAWAVSATAIAVWGGALGSIGLFLRKRWAVPVFAASLAGIVMQDLALFVLTDAAVQGGAAVFVLQGLVYVIGMALLLLARRAAARGWLS